MHGLMREGSPQAVLYSTLREVEILQAFDEAMGHAGRIIRHPGGVLEGGADPRSDGAVAAF